jgi:hypothetical protein
MRLVFWVGTDLLSLDIYPGTIGAGGLNGSVRNGKRWVVYHRLPKKNPTFAQWDVFLTPQGRVNQIYTTHWTL